MKDKLLQLGEMEDILYERIDYKGRKLAFIKTLRRDFIGEKPVFFLTDRLINSFQAGRQKLQIRNLGTAG